MKVLRCYDVCNMKIYVLYKHTCTYIHKANIAKCKLWNLGANWYKGDNCTIL